MAGIEGNSPQQIPDQQYELIAEPNLAQLVAESDALLVSLQSETLKTLGKQEQQEFLKAVEENKDGSQTAFSELRADIAALDVIEEKFGKLKNYQEFVHFLGSGELSENELEGMYNFIEEK